MAPMSPLQQRVGSDEEDEEPQDHDRLSELPDHILLLVLEKLRGDVRSLARTCVLSKRWSTLPLLLPELEITVRTFIPAGCSRTVPLLYRATGSFTGALRFFLATPAAGDQRRAIKTLDLQLYLTSLDYLYDACQLAGDAITRGEVRDLNLAVRTGKGRSFLPATTAAAPKKVYVARCFARRFMLLLLAAPAAAMFGSLKALRLDNLCFRASSSRAPSDVGTLLHTCTALEILTLECCGFADAVSSVLAIDAPPHSQLRVLDLLDLRAGSVHLVQAPRLVSMTCSQWMAASCPVTFGPGSTPSLQEFILINRAATWQLRFNLSELLENAHHLQILRMDFCNDKIWVQPESPKALGPAFSELKTLRLAVIPEGDLSWTMFLLQAAPLLELVDIEVYEHHACSKLAPDDEREIDDLVEWEVPAGFRHRRLRELRFRGGIDAGKKDVGFARLVVERAASLELLVLDGRVTCEECVAAQRRDSAIVLSRFPVDKDGVDEMVSEIKDGITTCARVVVYSASNRVYEY